MTKFPRAAALVKPAVIVFAHGRAFLLVGCLLGCATLLSAQNAVEKSLADQPDAAWANAVEDYYNALKGKSATSTDWLRAANNLQEFRALGSSSEHASEAKAYEALALLRAVELGAIVPAKQLQDAVARAKGELALPQHLRFVVASRAREVAIEHGSKLGFPERLDAYSDSARAMIEEFPTEEEPYRALLAIAKDHPDAAKRTECAQELLGLETAPIDVKSEAAILLAREALVGRPLDTVALRLQREATQLSGSVVVLYTWRPDDEKSSAMHRWLESLPDVKTIPIDVSSVIHAKDTLQLTAPGLVYLLDKSGIIRDVHGERNFLEKVERLQKEGVS